MAYETIILAKEGKIATITLNRPNALNALNGTMLREIQAAIADVRDDAGIKVAVFRGAGRAFGAGIDVKEATQTFEADPAARGHLLRDTFHSIRYLLKPVVCGVQGYCLGAALEIMVSCDIIVAADTAKFSMPEINIGVASMVEAAILARAMSIFRAKEMVLMGEYFDAAKAERLGLINEVVPADRLDARVREVANILASKDANALAVQKDIINKWMNTDLEAAIDYSVLANTQCGGRPAQQEAMRAFVEKRKPKTD